MGFGTDATSRPVAPVAVDWMFWLRLESKTSGSCACQSRMLHLCQCRYGVLAT